MGGGEVIEAGLQLSLELLTHGFKAILKLNVCKFRIPISFSDLSNRLRSE